MKNYAKFCKLNYKNRKFQLNLTEGGLDGTGFFTKCMSILRFAIPGYFIYCLSNALYFEFVLNKSGMGLAPSLIFSFILTCACTLPHTNFGNIYNSIFKNFIYKQKIKKFYEDMRNLEIDKNFFLEKNDKKQQRKAKKIIKYFFKETRKFYKLTKTYYRKKQKKGYLDGIKGYALETLETRQETIDKFIFHNAKLLIQLCPKYKDFILNRFKNRLENIKNNEAYYDEFVWTAETGENLIKNDCIDEDNSSNYIENLQKLLKLSPKQNNLGKTTSNLKSENKTENHNLDSKKDDVFEEYVEKIPVENKKIEKQILNKTNNIYKLKKLDEFMRE